MKMKRFNLIPLALTTLMLGACSSEDGLNLGGGNSVAQGEKGYISFSLNLPTVKSTANRANDDFDDGAATEYNVKDATLLLFSGANEGEATFAGAYDLGEMTGGTSDGDNITTTYQIAQKVTKPVGANVYAMVVINGKASNVLTESGGTWSIKGQTLTASTTKYKDLAGAAYNLSNTDVANIASTADGGCFLMTNAPLYTKAGGVSNPTGGSVQTLTEINPNNIFTTKEEAKANPAANVYVERAVAKVTVTGNPTGTQDDDNIANYEIKGWTLDVTNQSSYLVRNVNDADWWSLKAGGVNDYRFVGAAAVADGLYRTYWGIDPNYSTGGTFTTQAGTTPTSLKAVGANDYCLENTFNLTQMKDNQTTRVIVAAALDLDGNGTADDFYVLDNDKSNTTLTFDGITNTVKAAYLANGTVVNLLKANLNGGASIGADDLDVTFDQKATTGGYVTVTEITIKAASASNFKNGAIPEGLQAANNDAIIADVNAAHKIAYYKGGVSYYPVMIKHFGDDLTPWNNGEVYGSNNADFLGRYGVLRNNWYSINVTGIKNIGDPEVPKVYGTPDDPSESWISVTINILSWAKRSQSVDL
ncbi:putative uncharacterized protein [Prevotella sp. CAG:617]|nr:putative uncharacterized protein [Prevotella sp. CAG:617]